MQLIKKKTKEYSIDKKKWKMKFFLKKKLFDIIIKLDPMLQS
jgi:hypothetical protein